MRKMSVIAAVICFAAFLMLSKYEDRPWVRAMDFAATVKIQDRIDRSVHLRLAQAVDTVMTGATFFAGPGFSIFGVLVLSFVDAYTRKRRLLSLRSLLIPAGFVLITLAELYGKSVVLHPSPPFSLVKHPTTVFPSDYINEQYSYPSGHAARALYMAIVAISIWFHVRGGKSLRSRSMAVLLAAGYVMLVSIGKLYLGQHWFSDILGGIALGGTFGFLVAAAGSGRLHTAIDARMKATYNRRTMSD